MSKFKIWCETREERDEALCQLSLDGVFYRKFFDPFILNLMPVGLMVHGGKVTFCRDKDDFDEIPYPLKAWDEEEQCFITIEKDRDGIEEGDKVVLTQNGMAYPFYAQFFEDNKVDRITSARYAYGDVPRKGAEGIVIGIYPDDENELALIRVGRYVYLIDVDGLEKV